MVTVEIVETPYQVTLTKLLPPCQPRLVLVLLLLLLLHLLLPLELLQRQRPLCNPSCQPVLVRGLISGTAGTILWLMRMMSRRVQG